MKLSRVIPLAVLACFVVGAIIYSESLQTRAEVGAVIPTFELQQLDGTRRRVSPPLGSPMVINFWASWCEPCLEEMPAHEAFYRRYGDRIVYLGINEREPPVKIREHLERLARDGAVVTYPILLDLNGQVGERFRQAGLPETWFVDPRGVARFHWRGLVRFEQLEAAYREAMGVAPDAGDGGPFHGTTGARSVLIGAESGVVYVGGSGGVARYQLTDGGAAGADFVWEPAAGVPVLARTADGAPLVLTGDAWPGLPANPTALAEGHGRRLAWVPGHGLFAAAAGQGAGPAAAPAGDDAAAGGWQPLVAAGNGLDGVAALAADPLVADRWLAATAAGLLESRDGGRTWRPLDLGLRVYGLAFDPAAPERLYLATDSGVWLSQDGGRRAVRLAGSPQRIIAGVDAAELPQGGTWLVAVAPNGDVYGSQDGGRTWALLVPRTV
ncbi:MAG TPA: redoxin domain-containing protein [Limnochordales bacterium]